jgi:hypothetical protein
MIIPTMKLTHKWHLDFIWDMVNWWHWFYMVNHGYIQPTVFLHVRILGVCSTWEIEPTNKVPPEWKAQ